MKRALAIALLAACRAPGEAPPRRAVDPPVSAPESIPDAPVSGTIRGAPFVVRDARYVVDRRVAYEHTDVVLSSGKADAPCGPIAPASATSVWLRLEGDRRIETKDLRLPGPDDAAWSVHYQVFDGERWRGVGEGGALVAMRAPGADGRLTGALAVCFADDAKSCVSGSFEAVSCPPAIDQPVRGALPPEPMPEQPRK